MITRRLLSAGLLAAVAAGTLTLGTGSAEAVKPRRCPDGTVVTCTERCPCPGGFKTKGGKPKHAQAPKPTDSSAKWRTYINGGIKAPVRPKP
jgi:hypothetical protein